MPAKQNFSVSSFALMIWLVVILMLSGCCMGYEMNDRNVPKYVFVTGQTSIVFENQLGQQETLVVGEIECGFEDPVTNDYEDCVKNRNQLCGQGVARSKEDHFMLDFSHRRGFNEEAFLFDDSYFSYDPIYGPQEMDTLNTISSMQVQGIAYFHVKKIVPIPRLSAKTIDTLYYVNEIGPIRYVLTNGDRWDRMP